ncbi:MAG TPA: outer membrane beta-barrel protein [Blastocatellia bacterium]|nr:outer membrane beta-barrel protein [Blastocatellia bacterium]
MRKLLFLLLLLGACPVVSQAQDDVPGFEVFGGYSYLRTGNPYDQNSHGWNTSVSANLTKHIAVKADFGGYYDRYSYNTTLGAVNVTNRVHTFLFGPQLNMRASERVNPFVHVLFGAANDKTFATRGAARTAIVDVGFAMAAGGGVDAKLSDGVSFRIFQSDYLLTRYRDTTRLPLAKRNLHHFRLSTGLVFH